MLLLTLNQLLYHVHKLIQNACHCQNVSYPYVESCYIRRLPCVGDPLAYKMSWGRDYTGGKVDRIGCEVGVWRWRDKYGVIRYHKCSLEIVLVEWRSFLGRNEWTHCSSVQTLSDQCNTLSIMNGVGGNYWSLHYGRACLLTINFCRYTCYFLLHWVHT